MPTLILASARALCGDEIHLVEHDPHRCVRVVELVDPESEHVAIDDRHSLDSPAGGMAGDRPIDLLAMLPRSFGKPPGPSIERLVGDVLRSTDVRRVESAQRPLSRLSLAHRPPSPVSTPLSVGRPSIADVP